MYVSEPDNTPNEKNGVLHVYESSTATMDVNAFLRKQSMISLQTLSSELTLNL